MSIRRMWPHPAFVCILVIMQLAIFPTYRAVYSVMFRQRLLASGALPCAAVEPLAAEHMPVNCDLMAERVLPDGMREHIFYSKGGEVRTTVLFQGDVFVNAAAVYLANVVSMILPITALFASTIATLHKMCRTRSLLTLQMWRHSYDRLELMLHLYSIPIFLSGIASMWLHSR